MFLVLHLQSATKMDPKFHEDDPFVQAVSLKKFLSEDATLVTDCRCKNVNFVKKSSWFLPLNLHYFDQNMTSQKWHLKVHSSFIWGDTAEFQLPPYSCPKCATFCSKSGKSVPSEQNLSQNIGVKWSKICGRFRVRLLPNNATNQTIFFARNPKIMSKTTNFDLSLNLSNRVRFAIW